WRRVGRPEKSLFVAFDNGYHGDTIGSMSVGGIDLFHSGFGPLLFDCERMTFPHAYGFPGTEEECAKASLTELERLFGEQAPRIAWLVVEALGQAGDRMAHM